jgi:putative zinc finger protein
MLLSCKETTRLLSQGADRELGVGERVTLRLHLVICNGCRNVGSQFKFLRLAVKRLAEDGNDEPTRVELR